MKRTHAHADQPNAPDDVDVEEQPAATPKQIANILEIARAQVKLKRQVDALTEDLKKTKEQFETNKTNLLPKALEDAGLKGTPLGNGASVEIDTIVRASIPSPNSKQVENAEERNRIGIEYANEHCPDLVKYVVSAYFDRDQYKLFKKFQRDMAQRKIQIPFEVEATVHTQTLSKWVRGQDALGKSVDEAALNVHRVKVAEVQLPKADKDKVKGKKK